MLGELIGRGWEADVYALSARVVFRTERSNPERTIDRATLALEAARKGGVAVPDIVSKVTIAGTIGIAMERLEPTSMLRHLGRRPWLVQEFGRIMGSIHSEMHQISGPKGLPALADSAFAHAGDELLMPPLTRGESGKLLHGDFTPANLLRHPDSKRWMVVDWGGALRGSPEADVGLTLAAIGFGAPPETASPLVRFLSPFGRRLLRSSYVREYLRHRPLEWGTVIAWTRFWVCHRRIA